MSSRNYALFETAIGPCAVAWGAQGITTLLLPAGDAQRTKARLLAQWPDALEAQPPPHVKRAQSEIEALVRGEDIDLNSIELDMTGVPSFHREVYQVARTISRGETRSYGAIATQLGKPGAARAVGQALGRNPFAIVVPCHRVLAASGKIGGFSATGGITTKLQLLAIERSKRDSQAKGDGLGYSVENALAHLRTRDPALGRLIASIGPFAMQRDESASLFLSLARSIVYQQLNGRAAATIFARVRALFPRVQEGFTPKQILRTSDEKLKGAGLSRSKLLALRDLAEKASAGLIPTLDEVHLMTDEDIIERLTQVRGIGRWTVEMLLIFRLGRPDVLPLDDFGVRQGFAVTFGKASALAPNREQLEKRGAKWKPYRSVASWYLWRAADRSKKLG